MSINLTQFGFKLTKIQVTEVRTRICIWGKNTPKSLMTKLSSREGPYGQEDYTITWEGPNLSPECKELWKTNFLAFLHS